MKYSLPTTPGTYALILEAVRPQRIRIGRLGEIEVKIGFYIYVGSAFGPGGLKARVGRHIRQQKKSRWHIDYFRKHLKLVDVWYHVSDEKQECVWAARFESAGGKIHFPGFGSSDCKCRSHLFYFDSKPERDHGFY